MSIWTTSFSFHLAEPTEVESVKFFWTILGN
jgi:hypothetical protein